MFELGFGILLLFGLVLVVYPLRKLKGFAILIVLLFVGGAVLAYKQWGGFSQFRLHQQALGHEATIKKLAAQYQTPSQLIHKLKSQLEDTPKSAQGWYLLGKLYSAQGDWQKAHRVFAKALAFKPDNEQYMIQEIYASWMLNHQQVDDALRARIKSMLIQFPNQPDLLMILAMDAFEAQHYQQAIDYWQVLLAQTQTGSAAALKLQEAIARAQALKKKGELYDK